MTLSREQLIESYGRADEELAAAVARYPRAMWQFRAVHDPWTIHEILIHISDSEANSYVRCRRFLAEPGTALMAYDENIWARELDYHGQSPERAIELFKGLRKNTYELIRGLPDEAWSRVAYHPENGEMTLADWLVVYERHVRDHVAQMEAIFQAWSVDLG